MSWCEVCTPLFAWFESLSQVSIGSTGKLSEWEFSGRRPPFEMVCLNTPLCRYIASRIEKLGCLEASEINYTDRVAWAGTVMWDVIWRLCVARCLPMIPSVAQVYSSVLRYSSGPGFVSFLRDQLCWLKLLQTFHIDGGELSAANLTMGFYCNIL
jgi:hypothetical protein